MSRWQPSATSTASERRSSRTRAGASAFTRWEEMLAAGGLDALFVCTPPMHHAAPAIAAFEHGLAVYLEKPLARSLPDGEAIVAAWERSGMVCAVGYQWRSLDVVGQLRTLLGGAQPGLLVSRSFGPTEGARHDLEQGAAWFADPAISGGLLFELASHDIDLQIALAGPVESVQATGGSGLLALAGRPRAGWTTPSRYSSRFAAGGIGACHVAWSTEQSPPLYALDVQAADAALQLVLDPVFELRGRDRGGEISAARQRAPSPLDGHPLPGRRAPRRSRRRCPAPPPTALATLRALLACEQAIASGERVAVEPF